MDIDIESIKRKLLIKYPPFGMILANTSFEVNTSIDTAATDGKIIYYNPSFINCLSQEEQVFIFAHEISHIAFDHVFKSEGKDMETWNIATDAVINANLVSDGLPLIANGVNMPEAINYDAEEMYIKLMQEQKQNGNQQNSQDQSGNGNPDSKDDQSTQSTGKSNSSNSSQDKSGKNSKTEGNGNQKRSNGPSNHGMWDEAIKRRKAGTQNPSEIMDKAKPKETDDSDKLEKSNLFDKLFKRNKKKEPQKTNQTTKDEDAQSQKPNEDEKKKQEQIKKLTELGENKTFKQNKIDRKKQLEELRQALAEQSHGAGHGTDRKTIQVSDIGIAAPLIDWRRLLKEAVKYNIDWSYRNASIEDGIVTPYLEEIPQPETEIVLDTSGSINITLLRNFLRECKNILQNSKVKVGCFDDKFYGFTEIRNESDIDNMQFIGRGGTNFNAAVNAFTRRVENKIIFTDGRAPMPDKQIDAIWIVFGGATINPKGGRVIYITDEQLSRLCSYINDTPSKGRTR